MVTINETRVFQAFYTKSTPIVDYMVHKLLIKSTDKIFEPCGGDGVFIEAILDTNEFAHIDVCELDNVAIGTLNKKFAHYLNVNIRQCDTLLDNDLSFNSSFGGVYDKIIANPPYGAWQDFEKRDKLKKLFPNIYAKETYALFLYRCIELLKEDGILSFIIPDTFLNLHTHEALRKHILSRTKIVELALFPSSFFPNVNFGYANLSIITLQKCLNKNDCLDNDFTIINDFKKVEQLLNPYEKKLNHQVYNQRDIFNNAGHSFLMAKNKHIVETINNAALNIGDVANCVTGFYSGNDKQFLQVINSALKNGKNYEVINADLINQDYKNNAGLLEGINTDNYFLPIVKGGNIKYLKPESWFMNWSKEAVLHYKTDKKARFQNPKYYFKFGIGVPMISASKITASLIENKLFDQSIVGIFPKNSDFTYYLLGFFNSPTCNTLVRTINPSANNPANYIKKIPYIKPSEAQKIKAESLVLEILNEIKTKNIFSEQLEIELFGIYEEIYGF
jgi:adenine-specific DNA-methyltransferase